MTKKTRYFAVMLATLLASLAGAFMQLPPAGPSLSRYAPAGALLVLEAKNFAALLGDWNASAEKSQWLQSDNYDVFSRSKLFFRLGDARDEFAAAAGFSPGMPLVESIAGDESVLALYDIGDLRFLYITRLGSARALENLLWQSRASFEPRSAAGQNYYLRLDAASGRQVVFAATDDYLLLATAEEPLAQALTLLAGQPAQPVINEAWYRDAAASRPRGDLRLVLNIGALVPSPYFRSYWVQRNITELAQYRAGIVDLFRSSAELREERVFLRRGENEAPPPAEDSSPALAQVARLVPPDAGFYRAWKQPQPSQVIELLRQRLLDPAAGPSPQSLYAPQVYTGDAVTGSEAALETRIDEPPPTAAAGAFSAQPITELLASNPAVALLQVESSAAAQGQLADGVSSIVLLGTSSWDQPDVLEAIQSAVREQWTVSSLGAGWTQLPGDPGIFSLDGLVSLHIAARGPFLFLANSPGAVSALLARLTQPVEEQDASFAAGLRHGRQRQPYATLMSRLDFLQGGFFSGGQQREPYFFSENIVSLSETLSRVESVSRRSRDEGPRVVETVTYRMP